MAISLADQYYIKALDDYPYNMEQALENINYALSYDDEHAGALFLMGSFCMDLLNDYEKAETYFLRAMAVQSDMLKLNFKYAELLLIFKEYDKVANLMAYTKTIRGCDEGNVFLVEGFMHEQKGNLELAKDAFHNAALNGFNSDFVEFAETAKKRVLSKIEKLKKVIWT